jgi:hypothetical protein
MTTGKLCEGTFEYLTTNKYPDPELSPRASQVQYDKQPHQTKCSERNEGLGNIGLNAVEDWNPCFGGGM